MNFGENFFDSMEPKIQKAFDAMTGLENGAIANPDEKRMVGHYWLRNPFLAPSIEIRREIQENLEAIEKFASQIHNGTVRGADGVFKNLLVIGIGGSALGPQFVANALGCPGSDKLNVHFLDNTDPDGMARVLSLIRGELGQTLCVVISKSGETKETRNGMVVTDAAYQAAGFRFAAHAVAITGKRSSLDQLAEESVWLHRFPMWDWVGGRTSETSAVGLLPAALQGIDIRGILAGARACDDVTRNSVTLENPAAQMALMWYYVGGGKGEKDMVILPYKDRLELFSRYLQQLVMESLGKTSDLEGRVVNQGIAVYGNKGSTDQHAYIQQLRDGINNFFVTFIEVLKDQREQPQMVERNVTSGDYLHGFFLGTRNALYEKDRESITVTIQEVSPFNIGVLIALYERTVGLYASLININAYNQPGVEAGKKAASEVISKQLRILEYLSSLKGQNVTCERIADGIGATEEIEAVFKICEHLASNSNRGVQKTVGVTPFDSMYAKV